MNTFKFNDPWVRDRFAVRNWDRLIPGRLYLWVHTQDPNVSYEWDPEFRRSVPTSFPDFCDLKWVTGKGVSSEGASVYWSVRDDCRISSGFVSMSHASDSGIWHAPKNLYHNTNNYMLDVDSLRLSHSIVLDMEKK